MKHGYGLKEALDEMLHHKLRTILTLLGMVFGVGAVIAMLSIGEGAQRESLALIESMGLRNILVNAKRFDQDRLKEIREHSNGLGLRDLDAALSTLPFLEGSSAEKKVKTYSLFSFEGQSDGQVIGVTPSFFAMADLRAAAGKLFDEKDNLNLAAVTVLGTQAAQSLFPEGAAVGQFVKVNHVWLRVVGVLRDRHLDKEEFQGVKLGNDRNQIFLPLSTVLKRLKFEPLENQIDSLRLRLDGNIDPEIAAQALNHLLDRRHSGENDFEIVIPAALLAQQKKTQQIFTIVMSCIAGISLLVGGIGIMNIMLATVLERTKEIGLLRAVGARQQDIRQQFLVESFTIAAVGAAIGVVFGIVLAMAIQYFAKWPVGWSLWSVLLAVSICLMTGVTFGWYPAKRAAELDPITALHTD